MKSLKYRPEIDGLRSLAIVPVLVYHLNSKWMLGGFVGVDMFFVISGFLITSLVEMQFEAGVFTVSGFYRRRIARLFPAFAVCTVAVMAAALLLYQDQDIASVGAIASAAALVSANFKLMFQGSYFQVSKDAVPLLHFWSLAIEEQFYAVWPMILLWLHYRKSSRCAKSVWIGGLLVTSFGLGLWASFNAPIFAFYMLPTRAWELLAGCALAVSAQNRVSERFATPVAVLALAFVVASLVICSDNRPFPGWQATVPVIGTVLFLSSVDGRSFIGRCFCSPLIVYIGRCSYSLYLWHWPVYCFVDYRMLRADAATRPALKIALTIVLAVISFELIERPLRRFLSTAVSPRALFGATVCISLAIVLTGLEFRQEFYLDATVKSVKSGGLSYNFGDTDNRVVLIGDSHGSMYGRLIRDIARSLKMSCNILSVAAQDPLPSSTAIDSILWHNILIFLDSVHPNVVVFSCEWSGKLSTDHVRLRLAIAELKKRCKHVIILTEIPILEETYPREAIRKGEVPPFFEVIGSRETRQRLTAELLQLADERVTIVDVSKYLVAPNNEIRVLADDSRLLYHDKSHLSGAGARLIRERLQTEVASAVSR